MAFSLSEYNCSNGNSKLINLPQMNVISINYLKCS